jgi:Skp family chaperone for outer membrane proteins
MRKQFLYLFLSLVFVQAIGPNKSTKLGFIDMEYILQNVPDYTETKAQLELKLKMET